LFIRNRLDLTSALDITPTYLRNPYSDVGTVIDYRNWQISLGRRFRSLKIWFVMRSYGDHFEKLTRTRPDLFEIISTPAFCLTVLRIKPPSQLSSGHSETPTAAVEVDEVSNTLTKKIYEIINARGEIFLTSTVIAGVYAIRVVTALAREEKVVDRAFEILVQTSEEMIAEMEEAKTFNES
jgi:aromatic-L-amino-acid decarboxylase